MVLYEAGTFTDTDAKQRTAVDGLSSNFRPLKKMLYFEYFHRFALPSDSPFWRGTEAIIDPPLAVNWLSRYLTFMYVKYNFKLWLFIITFLSWPVWKWKCKVHFIKFYYLNISGLQYSLQNNYNYLSVKFKFGSIFKQKWKLDYWIKGLLYIMHTLMANGIFVRLINIIVLFLKFYE